MQTNISTNDKPFWDPSIIPEILPNLEYYLGEVLEHKPEKLMDALSSLPKEYYDIILLQIYFSIEQYINFRETFKPIPKIISARGIIMERLGKENTRNWPLDVWYGQLFSALRDLWDIENELKQSHKYPIDEWGLLEEEYKTPIDRSVVLKLISIKR